MYETAKVEREAKRMERRRIQEEEIIHENEKLEAIRKAAKDKIDLEEKEYEAMKEKER